LLCLARADITTKRPEKKRKGLEQIEELGRRISALAAEDSRVPPLPSGIGDAVMVAFGLPPSRKVGDVKRALEEAVESGEIPPQQPAEVYVEFVRSNRERFGI
jgi:poly(A) polymerase